MATRQRVLATLASTNDLQKLNELREARALSALQAQREKVRAALSQKEARQQTVVSLQQELFSLQNERTTRRNPTPEWLKASDESERWLEEDILQATKLLEEAQQHLDEQMKLMQELQHDWTRLRTRADGLGDLEKEQKKILSVAEDKRATDALDDVNTGVMTNG